MIKLSIILFSFFGSFSDSTQLKSDLKLLNESMKSRCYSANIRYKTYIDSKLMETSNSNIQMDGELYKIQWENVIKINSKNFNLLVDQMNKVLVVSDKEPINKAMSELPSLDSFLAKSTNIIQSELDSSTRRYKFHLKGCKEKTVEFDLDLKTHRLKRIWIEYNEPYIDQQNKEHQKSLEITYISYQPQSSLPLALFSTNSYIAKKGKVFITSASTAGYKIIDLINNKVKTK